MNLEQTTDLYASVLRQLLPVGGYDTSPHTEALSVDVYAHAKLLAQADLDAKRILSVLEAIPQELINEYELEYGLPLKCTVNASRTFEERIEILNWVRINRNVLNRAYLEQLLAIFGVVLIDVVKFKPMLCTAACDSPVNTEQLRYKVFLRLQYPMNADMNCIIENYLPGYLRIEWMVDMPWSDWTLNPGMTINTNGIAHYTAYKTNQREFYDSYANLDLTAAIVRSLHDSDMQQWQAVTGAITSLIGNVSYSFDNQNCLISYKSSDISYNDPSIKQYWQTDTSNGNTGRGLTACEACENHRSYDSRFTSTNCSVITTEGNRYCYYVWPGYTNAAQGGKVYLINNPNYNLNAPIPLVTLPYLEIAKKIITNTSSSDQAISLFSEIYIETVANSIFNADESKQFVKLSDLLSQFELNKTLRT